MEEHEGLAAMKRLNRRRRQLSSTRAKLEREMILSIRQHGKKAVLSGAFAECGTIQDLSKQLDVVNMARDLIIANTTSAAFTAGAEREV